MSLFTRPDGTTVRLEIRGGIGQVWIYNKDGKCIRRPISDIVAHAQRQATDQESPTEGGPAERAPDE